MMRTASEMKSDFSHEKLSFGGTIMPILIKRSGLHWWFLDVKSWQTVQLPRFNPIVLDFRLIPTH